MCAPETGLLSKLSVFLPSWPAVSLAVLPAPALLADTQMLLRWSSHRKHWIFDEEMDDTETVAYLQTMRILWHTWARAGAWPIDGVWQGPPTGESFKTKWKFGTETGLNTEDVSALEISEIRVGSCEGKMRSPDSEHPRVT